MPMQLEEPVALQAELILQAAWNEVLLPACIVEAELVSVRSKQKLWCPQVAEQFALQVIVLPQQDASLWHPYVLRISFSSVSLYLLHDREACVFVQLYACFCFRVDAVSMWVYASVEWDFVKVILSNELPKVIYDLEVSIYPHWDIIVLKILVRTYLH